jgi:hypothetical protein
MVTKVQGVGSAAFMDLLVALCVLVFLFMPYDLLDRLLFRRAGFRRAMNKQPEVQH